MIKRVLNLLNQLNYYRVTSTSFESERGLFDGTATDSNDKSIVFNSDDHAANPFFLVPLLFIPIHIVVLDMEI